MCIFGIAVLVLLLALVGYLTYTAKAKRQADDEAHRSFMDKTDDLENDVAAMSFSVAWTMLVRFALTNHHPSGVAEETDFEHTAGQRAAMLVYAFLCLLIALFSVKICSKKAATSQSYAVKRLMTFFNTVAAMNVAWAFLYWGEWEFVGNLAEGEPLKGRVMFAVVATFVSGFVLVALAKFPGTEARVASGVPEYNTTGKNDKMVALTALALVCAWSWELCFDAAMEDMTEGVGHPVAIKVFTAFTLCAIIVPVYAFQMRPITAPAAAAIGA
jgi:Ca2+/Na+ antiporter